ncbi:hypothetical protein H696_04550 [Fonticula alba]|uniref:UBA domain-containing protein n=1 Tax=Fonticula alba TaxID=691883 RepID=A0A058Z4E2_FONAL|nr:hypothetical protein H696_04550 [Fonticula alba]KCV69135.1 hypothetical protein H696_04550 [Fonticula alba]|eukprot:XP_009496706.1 hypothetical protein H696_04550 [Fonticula alba]
MPESLATEVLCPLPIKVGLALPVRVPPGADRAANTPDASAIPQALVLRLELAMDQGQPVLATLRAVLRDRCAGLFAPGVADSRVCQLADAWFERAAPILIQTVQQTHLRFARQAAAGQCPSDLRGAALAPGSTPADPDPTSQPTTPLSHAQSTTPPEVAASSPNATRRDDTPVMAARAFCRLMALPALAPAVLALMDQLSLGHLDQLSATDSAASMARSDAEARSREFDPANVSVVWDLLKTQQTLLQSQLEQDTLARGRIFRRQVVQAYDLARQLMPEDLLILSENLFDMDALSASGLMPSDSTPNLLATGDVPARSPREGSAPTPGATPAAVHDAPMLQLTDLGIEPDRARAALRLAQGNVTDAISLLFDRPHLVDKELQESSTSGSSQSSVFGQIASSESITTLAATARQSLAGAFGRLSSGSFTNRQRSSSLSESSSSASLSGVVSPSTPTPAPATPAESSRSSMSLSRRALSSLQRTVDPAASPASRTGPARSPPSAAEYVLGEWNLKLASPGGTNATGAGSAGQHHVRVRLLSKDPALVEHYCQAHQRHAASIRAPRPGEVAERMSLFGEKGARFAVRLSDAFAGPDPDFTRATQASPVAELLLQPPGSQWTAAVEALRRQPRSPEVGIVTTRHSNLPFCHVGLHILAPEATPSGILSLFRSAILEACRHGASRVSAPVIIHPPEAEVPIKRTYLATVMRTARAAILDGVAKFHRGDSEKPGSLQSPLVAGKAPDLGSIDAGLATVPLGFRGVDFWVNLEAASALVPGPGSLERYLFDAMEEIFGQPASVAASHGG